MTTSTMDDVADHEVGAALLASGIGATVLGIMVVGAEASTNFASSLRFVASVGPLSGKTTVAVIAFILSWVILHLALPRTVKLSTAFNITLVLIGLGLLLTFPPFFEIFAAE